MMKKFICLFLIFLIALPATFSYVYADFLNINKNDKSIRLTGNGTLENPYIITSARELDEIRNNLSAHYKLGNDIDLTE